MIIKYKSREFDTPEQFTLEEMRNFGIMHGGEYVTLVEPGVFNDKYIAGYVLEHYSPIIFDGQVFDMVGYLP